jgi:dTDP-4-dehydrorhamnose 3,5-epimerase
MHYQKAPCAEAKLVRCTMGSIYDVIVDLRPDSATYCQWFGVELSGHGTQCTVHGTRPTAHGSLLTADRLLLPADHKMLYIPEGFAHGFITLEDNSEIFYQMSEFYSPKHAGGFRWNDPFFRIPWPVETAVISERDRSYPDYIREQ